VSPAANLSLAQVLATLALVVVAVAVSRTQRVELEREIGVAVVRSAIQLIAVGYVIAGIFAGDTLLLVVVLLAAMVIFGAATATRRARGVPGAFGALLVALAVAATTTIGLVVALGVFEPTPRYLVPVGGMVIGNSMTAAAVSLNRLGDDVRAAAPDIEAALALGATSAQAVRDVARRSLRSGMIPLIDSTKTTGLVFFPGTMVGALLAGAEPFDAVRLQLVLLYVLLGGVAVSSLLAVTLAYRRFFTTAHQLRPASAQPERR